MISLEEMDENFKFIVLEVTKQMEDTFQALNQPSDGIIDRIYARDDYIDNLKSIIEEKCFLRILKSDKANKQVVSLIRSVNIISSNLEKMADYAVNIVGQLQYFNNHSIIEGFDYESLFTEIFNALENIEVALLTRNITMALDICRREFELDKLYKVNFEEIMGKLKMGKDVGDFVTLLFIFQYLERAGDALLNIGEAIIFSVVGEKLRIHQYQALEKTLASSDSTVSISDFEIESIWEGRSGCRIGRLYDGTSQEVIFKEGQVKKLLKEKENLEIWETILPGLPPKIYNYQQNGDYASILVECLYGSTFQQMILNKTDIKVLQDTLHLIMDTIKMLWEKTKKPNPIRSSYLDQLSSRINDVYKVHPEFNGHQKMIGSLTTPSFNKLIEAAQSIDRDLASPFSVFIHGDFNINNIIYNSKAKRIHFIDVYRSREMDYVQDVSVFLISNFRIPVFDSDIRTTLNETTQKFYRFAKDFARQHDDQTFAIRLALGLIRSFVSSTRFEFNEDFAKAMQLRAVYLLEKLVNYKGSQEAFQFPEEVIMY